MYPDNLELLECRKREILGQLEKKEDRVKIILNLSKLV